MPHCGNASINFLLTGNPTLEGISNNWIQSNQQDDLNNHVCISYKLIQIQVQIQNVGAVKKDTARRTPLL